MIFKIITVECLGSCHVAVADERTFFIVGKLMVQMNGPLEIQWLGLKGRRAVRLGYHVGALCLRLTSMMTSINPMDASPGFSYKGSPTDCCPCNNCLFFCGRVSWDQRQFDPNWPINWRMDGVTLKYALTIHFDSLYIIIKCCFTSGEWLVNIHLDFWVKVVSKMLPNFTWGRSNASVQMLACAGVKCPT